MKTSVLLIWNVVLTIAVAVLLYFHFKKPAASASPDESAVLYDSISPLKIAYINVDTLQNNYELFSQKKKELEQKKINLEAQFQKKMADFQISYQAAQETAPKMTEKQLEETQIALQKQQMELQQMEERMSTDFQTELERFNRQLKDSLDSFLKTYNADKKYSYILMMTEGSSLLYAEPHLDITNDAITGMNERLKKK